MLKHQNCCKTERRDKDNPWGKEEKKGKAASLKCSNALNFPKSPPAQPFTCHVPSPPRAGRVHLSLHHFITLLRHEHSKAHAYIKKIKNKNMFKGVIKAG